MSEYLGWFGSFCIVASIWLLGKKWRHSFLLGIVGNLVWASIGWGIGRPDMIALPVVVTVLSVRSWWLWGKNKTIVHYFGVVNHVDDRGGDDYVHVQGADWPTSWLLVIRVPHGSVRLGQNIRATLEQPS